MSARRAKAKATSQSNKLSSSEINRVYNAIIDAIEKMDPLPNPEVVSMAIERLSMANHVARVLQLLALNKFKA